jgi:hypothetical protein
MTRPARHKPAGASARSADIDPPADQFKPPLKPHPLIFIALCIVIALWVGALVWMYVKTVYPQRHHASTAATQRLKPP